MKKFIVSALALVMILGLATAASAQPNKMAKCGNIQASVDMHDGSKWNNNQIQLSLLEKAGGWVISSGPQKGKNCPATKGQKLRFNFNDGANHPVNVKPSSKSGMVNVRSGSRPAIVLVDVKGAGTRAAIHFEITGSPNPKAKVDGCPGGNFYLEIE